MNSNPASPKLMTYFTTHLVKNKVQKTIINGYLAAIAFLHNLGRGQPPTTQVIKNSGKFNLSFKNNSKLIDEKCGKS